MKIRDEMLSADRKEVAANCVRVFDRIQGFRKGHQLMALCAAFTLMSEAAGVEPYDTYVMTKNLMADKMTASGMAPQFEAMKFHLKTEVLA